MFNTKESYREAIPELDRFAMAQAEQRLNELTKPLGSLGCLEPLLIRLAGMTQRVVPTVHRPHAVIFAADHGVTAESISAYDPEVTEQMVVNACMGSSVSSVLARTQGVSLTVVDVGVRSRVRHPAAIVRKIAMGTRNMVVESAMTLAEAQAAVRVGIDTVEELNEGRPDLWVIGEMGIGNTTASAAVIASLLELNPGSIVGTGTGISESQKWNKAKVVETALQNRKPNASDAWDVLTKVGGFEIAAMAGAMIASAQRRIPVLLDGVITAAAALFAAKICPRVADYLIATHRSAEPAHDLVQKALGLTPMVEWDMRLGEASGALMVLPILRNACEVMAQTATFGDARVSNPHNAEPSFDVNGWGTHRLQPTGADFSEAEREAVYKAILARRDIRSFLADPVPEEVLLRIIQAGHHGPSVGYMQPWNFIVIRSKAKLEQLQQAVERERVRAAENYQDLKRDYYLRLKVEGLLQAPVTLCVTNDTTRGGPHVLGRNTIPETDLMSTACAIENMWIAARAEGIGIGWVSIYQKQDIRHILGIPESVDPVALLSIGYTAHFPEIPLLERVGWGKRLELSSLLYWDEWGHQNDLTNFDPIY